MWDRIMSYLWKTTKGAILKHTCTKLANKSSSLNALMHFSAIKAQYIWKKNISVIMSPEVLFIHNRISA